MYGMFARTGLVGNMLGLAIAHSVIATPLVFINVSAALQSFNHNLDQAAWSLGANPLRAFFYVKLPLISPGVAAGGALAFATSLDEVVLSLFLSGVRSRTLPMQLWDSIRTEITPIIGAVAVLLMLTYAVLFSLVEGIQWWQNRKQQDTTLPG